MNSLRICNTFFRLTALTVMGCVLVVCCVVAAGQAFPDDALYFISSHEGNYRLYATDLSHNFTRRLHNQPVGYDFALAPDGSRIAFASFTRQTSALYVMDWNGKNLRVVSQAAGQRPSNLLWSPNSQQLAFAVRDGSQVKIFSINADGSNQRQLPTDEDESDKELLAWSPDGGQILFRMNGDRVRGINVTQDVDGRSTLQPIGDVNATSAQWSPDGHKLLLVTVRSGTNNRQIYVQDATCARSNLKQGCTTPLVSDRAETEIYDQAEWSPDSRHILLHASRTRLPGPRYIYVVDVDNNEWRRLTNDSEQEFTPVWSPSGQRVAYVTGGLNSSPKLVIAALDGGVEQLSNDIFSYYSPAWWP